MIKEAQKGFTILELLIATTVFTVILLVATTGIIKIGNLYYKGITSARTQDAARVITSEITTDLQFANGSKLPGSSSNIFCIGDKRYNVFFDVPYKANQSKESSSGLYVETLSSSQSCTTTVAPVSSKQMLGNNMRLLKFDVIPLTTSNDLWTVNIKIAYGDNDLLNHYVNSTTRVSSPQPDIDRQNAQCKSGIAGSSFCATAQLDTTVKTRLNSN